MKIDILTVSGSPQQVTEETIYDDGVQLGVGGAELALLTMCRAWTIAGHKVTLYNNPRSGGWSCFDQRNEDEFDPNEDRDILIYFRGPNVRGLKAKGKKIWWSTDQYTTGSYVDLANEVDDIVTISKFHADYFKNRYNIHGTTIIDIPVRDWEYQQKVKKVSNQVLFCSVPERGLMELAVIWKMITKAHPIAQLHITSDHRLWDASIPANYTMNYRMAFAEFNNVHYHSVVNREQLVQLQQESVIHLYPCSYDELFCISNAECQYAGAYPITSSVGALATTNMGFKAQYHPKTEAGQVELADATIRFLQYPNTLNFMSSVVKKQAQERFSIARAIEKWDEVFNE